jgi:hypothetical protein
MSIQKIQSITQIQNSTKKVRDFKVCLNPGHNPPMHMHYEPGEYEHTCPGCGHITKFSVPLITC